MASFLYHSPCGLKDRQPYLSFCQNVARSSNVITVQGQGRAGKGSGKRPIRGGSLVFSPAGPKPHGPVVSLGADLRVSNLHLEVASPRSSVL